MLRRFLRLALSWLPLFVFAALGLMQSARHAWTPTNPHRDLRADVRVDPPNDRENAVPVEWPRLVWPWLALLLLGGLEFGASFLSFDRSLRPLLMMGAVLMVAIVAVCFMEAGKGPTIVRGFAVAAMFWLIVLLALGSMDPLTRTDYHVPQTTRD